MNSDFKLFENLPGIKSNLTSKTLNSATSAAPPDPLGGLGGVDAAGSSRGYGGAAVTDHDRDPAAAYLYLIIEGYLAGILAACQWGEKPYGASI